MTPYWQGASTATAGMNEPLSRVPEADLSQQVARHLNMWCSCLLLDCCHNEMPEDNYAFTPGHTGHHVDSGSPESGYLYPWEWEPGDESWRTGLLPFSGKVTV